MSADEGYIPADDQDSIPTPPPGGTSQQEDAPSSPNDKLIETLQQQADALNALTVVVMELIQVVTDMIAMGAEDDSTPDTYLDGNKVDA